MRRLTTIILFSFFASGSYAQEATSWVEILEEKKGKMSVFYYPGNDTLDVLDRFEQDLLRAFADYLEKEYEIELSIEWTNLGSFPEILSKIENGGDGEFGVSTISITKERAKRFNYTPSYLADIQVLVTNDAFPLANTPNQLAEILSGGTGVSIPNTTLDSALSSLFLETGIVPERVDVSNTSELLGYIASNSTAYGYVDLINFLVSFKNLAQIRRQLFYPILNTGLGIIYSKTNDWAPAIEDYFGSEQFEKDENRIILKYFGQEIGAVINQMTRSSEFGLYEEIIISNREKEIQYEKLLNTLEREREQSAFIQQLYIVLIVVGTIVFALLISYRIKSKVNKVLMEQRATIEERNGELARLNQEKNDIIKVLAHDLRSPLSHIQGCSLILREDQTVSDDAQQLVEVVHDASDRIKSMISKILDVGAIESGKRNLQMEVVEPICIMQDVIEQNAEMAGEKEIEVLLEGSKELKAKADKFYLAQVLENLLSNALKFSKPQSEVVLSVRENGEEVRITVKDSGPGFTEEDKGKVFKKFAKLSATATSGEESVGLGLSIVKKYTDLMGAKISFHSETGVGTEFYIDLASA
ncbi:MAG: ATP-binding protein [Bacteroidota bacterium]